MKTGQPLGVGFFIFFTLPPSDGDGGRPVKRKAYRGRKFPRDNKRISLKVTDVENEIVNDDNEVFMFIDFLTFIKFLESGNEPK